MGFAAAQLPASSADAAYGLASCFLNTSRSQSREDILLLPTLLGLVGLEHAGSFVELGAFNGIDFSNTIALERCAGWRGLLIEANPINFAALAGSNRAGATYEHAGVCAEGVGFLNVTLAGGPAAGQHTAAGDHIRAHYHIRGGEASVPCLPLGTLMRRNGLRRAFPVSRRGVQAPPTSAPRKTTASAECERERVGRRLRLKLRSSCAAGGGRGDGARHGGPRHLRRGAGRDGRAEAGVEMLPRRRLAPRLADVAPWAFAGLLRAPPSSPGRPRQQTHELALSLCTQDRQAEGRARA